MGVLPWLTQLLDRITLHCELFASLRWHFIHITHTHTLKKKSLFILQLLTATNSFLYNWTQNAPQTRHVEWQPECFIHRDGKCGECAKNITAVKGTIGKSWGRRLLFSSTLQILLRSMQMARERFRKIPTVIKGGLENPPPLRLDGVSLAMTSVLTTNAYS